MSTEEEINETEDKEESAGQDKKGGNKPAAKQENKKLKDNKKKDDDGNSEKNDDKKGKKQGDTWEDKQKEKEKARKDEIFPWGSDPCVKLRLAGAKDDGERDISKPAGSNFPWYEKPARKDEEAKKQEKERQKAAKAEIEENKERSAEIKKRFREKLTEMSERNRRKRIYECSGFYHRTGIPFEVMEQRRMAAKKRRKNKEKESGDEEEEEEEEEEEDSKDQEEVEGEDVGEEKKDDKGKKKKDVKKKRKGDDKSGKRKKQKKKGGEWPGSYPQPIFEDFLFFLRLMVQAEYQTKESQKLALPPKKPPDDRKKVVDEFVSFLDVLLTANQMMRDKGGDDREKENDGEVESEKDTTNPPSQTSLQGEQEDNTIDNTNPEQIITETMEEQ